MRRHIVGIAALGDNSDRRICAEAQTTLTRVNTSAMQNRRRYQRPLARLQDFGLILRSFGTRFRISRRSCAQALRGTFRPTLGDRRVIDALRFVYLIETVGCYQQDHSLGKTQVLGV
jgi:hypothetical protein